MSSAVIAMLVMLSVILTASVLFPDISGNQILGVLGGGSLLAVAATLALLVWQRRGGVAPSAAPAMPPGERATWRMPPLSQLPRPQLTTQETLFITKNIFYFNNVSS